MGDGADVIPHTDGVALLEHVPHRVVEIAGRDGKNTKKRVSIICIIHERGAGHAMDSR